MKKLLALLMVLVLVVAVFAGCADTNVQTNTNTDTNDQQTEQNNDVQNNDSADKTEDPATDSNTQEDNSGEQENTEPDEPAVDEPAPYEAVDINAAVLKGPTGMGMAKLMEDAANGTAANNYTFTVSSDTAEVMAKVIAGEYHIAALPTNNAAIAFNKTQGGVKMAAINTLGTLYLLQNTAANETLVSSVSELEGKTIVTFGQGANPEYVLRHILESNGLTVGENVTIDFKATVDEVLALAATGEAEFVMVPEPNATVVQNKNAAFQIAIDMNAAWEEKEGRLVMGCIVTTAKFAEEHPEAVAKFLEEYEASINFALENTQEAAALCAKHTIVPSEGIALKSLPNCHLTFVSGSDMQPAVEGYYNVLFGYNPAAVGGAIPTEDFYFVY